MQDYLLGRRFCRDVIIQLDKLRPPNGRFFYGKIMKSEMLFITATHGNEGFSIDVMDQVEKKHPRDAYGYNRIIGNPRALDRNVRFTEKDLNRSAPGDLNSPIYEERRAAEIMRETEKYSSVIDIHGTIANSGIVTIIPYPTLENIVFSAMVPVKRNIIWYAAESESQGPLVQFINRPGISIECGPKDSDEIKERLREVVETVIVDFRGNNRKKPLARLGDKEYYTVYGMLEGDPEGLQDFEEVERDGERFYPFLAGQYEGIACYKMKEVDIAGKFLY